MTPADWARVNDLFHQALADWQGGDGLLTAESPEIGAEVRRMLSAHQALEETALEPADRCGQTIAGRYRLERLLGSGGSGEAWLSSDVAAPNRPVVVKVPHHWAWFRADVKRRFEDEARSLRRVDHPAIVSILDAGETQYGAPFLVMPYIEGEPLRALLDRGPVSGHLAASIAEQLGSAVQAAHDRAIVHRDIKPENLIVRLENAAVHVSLIDFGIAMFSEIDEQSSSTTRFFGTTQYMAPEQLLAKPVAASDIYAMALLIYEMAAGRPLFNVMTPAALYQAQRNLSQADLARVPPRLRRLLLPALNASPAKRPVDAASFGRKAAAALRDPGPAFTPSRRLIIAGTASAVLAGAWSLRNDRPLLASERRVDYTGGQTFRQVGWTPFGQIDSNMVEMNLERTAIVGNRVVSRRQGGYWYRFDEAVQKHVFNNRWRIRALLRPVHGFSAVTVTLPAAHVRYTCEIVVPDRGPVRAQVPHSILPRENVTGIPLDLSAVPQLTPIEMEFDPAARTVRATAAGRIISGAYAGCREFLDFPGVALSLGQTESEVGEAVFGDLHFAVA